MDPVFTYPHQAHWSHALLQFVLQADDPAVAQRAEEVFHYWPVSNLQPGRLKRLISTVRKTGDAWSFLGSQSKAPVVYRDIATVIRATETDTALAILQHHEHFLTAHGALLPRGDDGILIVGPSESGKSTTSCGLWAAGWQLLADDVTLLDTTGATASPLLRRVSLRHPSRALLGEDFWARMTSATTCDSTPEGYVFHPDELEGTSRARSVRLRAVIFLKRRGATDPGPASISPIAGVQALLSLCSYTNVIRQLGIGEAMARVGPLLNQVPCFDMGRGPLPAMIEAIEQLIQEPALEVAR